MVLSPVAGFLLGWILMKLLYSMAKNQRRTKLFSHLQIASASLVALSHGFNDAQKSMAIITLGLFAAGWVVTTHIPFWVIVACALMMGLGTATGGVRIIRTVGYQITRLQPIQGFAAESSASCVILAASFLGMPVSSTHMIVGSITGVGAAKGMRQVAWTTGKKILFAWLFTLPASAILSALIFKVINYL
jgi:PiT family inorganic phosphate transporter